MPAESSLPRSLSHVTFFKHSTSETSFLDWQVFLSPSRWGTVSACVSHHHTPSCWKCLLSDRCALVLYYVNLIPAPCHRKGLSTQFSHSLGFSDQIRKDSEFLAVSSSMAAPPSLPTGDLCPVLEKWKRASMECGSFVFYIHLKLGVIADANLLL